MICNTCLVEKNICDFEKIKGDYIRKSCKKCLQLSIKYIFYQRVRNIKKRSKLPISNDLRDHLIELWLYQNGKCYYTGVEMVLKGYLDNIENLMTIDRIDSRIGYVKGNLVLCCSIVNKIKQNLTIPDLLKWSDLIRSHSNIGV